MGHASQDPIELGGPRTDKGCPCGVPGRRKRKLLNVELGELFMMDISIDI